MKLVWWCVYIMLLIFVLEIVILFGKFVKKLWKRGRRIFDMMLKLMWREWEEFYKFEDVLKNDNGELMFMNFWVFKFDFVEIKVVDRIVKKYGFINYG